MVVELRSLASIQVGYAFRSRLESMNTGGIAVIQMKDLTEEGRVDCSALVRVDMERVKDHHLVRSGDLVFRSRGLVTKAALLEDDPGQAVVAAPLFRIRVKDKLVSPQYLNWFINQAPAQKYLASHSRGTAQQMVSIEALEALEIVVPSVERQRAVVEVAELAAQEQKLVREIAEARRRYISSTLLKSAKGE